MTSVEATDDRTVVMKVKKPTPIMLHLYVYILPEHIWKDIDEKEVKSFANEPGPDGIGRLRAVHRRGAQEGPVHPARGATRTTTRARRTIDELVFRVFQNEDSLAQALRRGEIDFADSLDANVFDSLKDAEGVKTFPATYSGFDEIAFNTGAALDDGTPIGDGHPALKDVKLRQALVLRDRHQDAGRPGARRLRQPGQQRHPAALRVAALRPGRDGVHVRPGEGQAAARRGGLHRGAGRHPHHAGRRPEAVVPAVRPRAARRPASSRCSSSPAGSRTSASRSSRRSCPRTRSPRSSARATSTCSSGAGSSSRTRTTSCRRSPAPTGRTRTAAASTPTCPTRSTATRSTTRLNAQQAEQIDPAERAETVKQMQKMLYDAAPYIVTFYYDNLRGLPVRPVHRVPAAARRRTGRCCSSTAPRATRASGR